MGVRLSRAAVEALSQQLREPAWLRRLRLTAWERYQQLPLPSGATDEEWRRTDLSGLDLSAVGLLTDSPTVVGTSADRGFPPELLDVASSEGSVAGLSLESAAILTYRALADELRSQGVLFTDLSTAAREHPALVQRYLTAIQPDDSKFEALHKAAFGGGVFIYVPPQVQVELPLRSAFWFGSSGALACPRTVLVADAGSRVLLVEEHLSPLDAGPEVASALHEIHVEEGAQVVAVSLQRWGSRTHSFASHRARVRRNGRLVSLVGSLGGAVTKASVETALMGPGAESRMYGIVFGRSSQHFDHYTLQDHLAPHTTSNLLYKAALRDAARSVYAGLIHVRPDAVKADAYQANRNLLLSADARADSMPKLEIETDDVRCTHGATVGPVDDEQVFYLMSRGLRRADAEQMIVEGFFEDVLAALPADDVREWVRTRVLDAVRE